MLVYKEGEAFFDALINLHPGALAEGIGALNKTTIFLYMYNLQINLPYSLTTVTIKKTKTKRSSHV